MEDYEYIVNEENSLALVIRNWLDEKECESIYKDLESVEMKQYSNTVFGKTYLQPRFNCVYGDDDISSMRYSNTQIPSIKWHPLIKKIRDRINEETGAYFNSCLINSYPTGAHYVSQHSDTEALGPGNMVITVSLGASRKFRFYRKSDKLKYETVLNNGDVCMMSGSIQETHTHTIPKELRVKDKRYSLTFRLIKSGGKVVKDLSSSFSKLST